MLSKSVFKSQMLILEMNYNVKIFTCNDEPEIKQANIEFWYSKLSKFSDDLLKAGINRLTDKHMYKDVVPAHVVQACKDILKENTLTVDEAYAEITRSFRKYYHGFEEGCKQAMDSYSPVVRKIVERHGGFYEISMKEGIDRDIFEREFRKEIDQEVEKEITLLVDKGSCSLEFKNQLLIGAPNGTT